MILLVQHPGKYCCTGAFKDVTVNSITCQNPRFRKCSTHLGYPQGLCLREMLPATWAAAPACGKLNHGTTWDECRCGSHVLRCKPRKDSHTDRCRRSSSESKKNNPAVMDVDRVSRRTTGTPASPPTESLLLPPGAENDDLFISKTTVTMVGGWWRYMIYGLYFYMVYDICSNQICDVFSLWLWSIYAACSSDFVEALNRACSCFAVRVRVGRSI